MENAFFKTLKQNHSLVSNPVECVEIPQPKSESLTAGPNPAAVGLPKVQPDPSLSF